TPARRSSRRGHRVAAGRSRVQDIAPLRVGKPPGGVARGSQNFGPIIGLTIRLDQSNMVPIHNPESKAPMQNDDSRGPETIVAVSRITAPKASDILAHDLRTRIRSGEWPEGLALPAERELSVQAGLSRTTVRQALRMLEIDGLIEIRPGRGGGARVRRPAGDELARQLELFIWGRKIGVEHLHDVREVLEALAAHGAALRRTAMDLADLEAKTAAVEAAVDHVDRYLDANLAWHMAVVRASHNELLISFVEGLSNAVHRATESEAAASPEVRAATLRIHRSILSAIAAGDAEAARRRMMRHVHAAHEVATEWEGAGNVATTDPGKTPNARAAEQTRKTGTGSRQAARKRNRNTKEAQ